MKKLLHLKFEFPHSVDKTNPVTPVQKGVTDVFKEKDNKLEKTKKGSEKGN